MAKVEGSTLRHRRRPGAAEHRRMPVVQSKVAPGLRNCQLCGTQVRTDIGHPLSQV